MKRLHSEVLIDASPAEVWAILTDFSGYREWNPFLVEASGVPREGTKLRVTLAPPGGRRITLSPEVTAVASGEILEWWGHLGVRGLFDGRHRFELHAAGRGTHLVQSEIFTGVLVTLVARSLDRGTAAGFALMNAALKAHAENQPADITG
jgi:hypothetical protein